MEKQQPFNFIKTKGAMSRIKRVVEGIKSGIPLILEGETGTSKTETAKQAAIEIKQKAIVFNFSSQTTIEDLLGRVSKNNDSWSGFSFIKGPFTEAFEKGYCIILDEINLAHETILQCIEASLDCQKLSLDFAGSEFNKTIQMHPDFHLIATQNPLTNRFSQKRNFLSNKFTSRFQKIIFNEIEYDELIEIATGLSKNIKNMNPYLIQSIVNFHFEWQKSKFSQIQTKSFSTYYAFTIREICRTIMSIKKGLTPFESILINYGSRYNDQSKQAMKVLLKKSGIKEEGTFFNNNSCIETIKNNFSLSSNSKIISINKKNNSFYMTDTLENALSNSFHLFDNFQSILIVGPDGCGKTSIGRWISELYPSVASANAYSNYKFFICNPEMMISDVIGRYVLYKKEKKTNKEEIINEVQIGWKYGPVIEASKNGECLILDQIDTAPSTILERLNPLFDGIGQKDFKFPIQENLEEQEILVNPQFRIIAISSLNGLSNLSPALLNRFTIIYVNEQLDYIDEEPDLINQFVSCLSPNASAMIKRSSYIKTIVKTIKTKLSKGSKLTSLNLSRCVNGFFKLLKKFPQEIKNKDVISILNFCLHLCIDQSKEIPDLDNHFIDVMLEYLDDDNESNQQYDTFHFKEAQSTRKVMATLVACSIIGLHIILVGRTGIGKTAAAMAFSRTLKSNKRKDTKPHMISFNGETQLDDLYGYFTIEDGNFTDHHGELSEAMVDGQVFIADELNLAEQQIIQSLNVAIEPSCGENIILPVTGSSITIKEGFFFIGCQNNLTMKGRKQLPESIRKKVLCINYPEASQEDFTKLCISIAKPFNIDNETPQFLAKLIEKINTESSLKPWSLREIRILFRRISYFQTETQAKGFTSMHHIAFMLISNFKNQPNMIEEIAKLVCSNFCQLDEMGSLMNDLKSDINVLKSFNGELVSQSDIDSLQQNSDIKNHSDYLVIMVKGSLELNIKNKQLFFIPDNIQNLWQTIFEVYLTYPSEPLLLNGPSGFKTYLSGLISSLSPVIYLHSDSTVSSLIGQITLLNNHQAKINLFDSLYDFAGYNLSIKKELNDIKNYIEKNIDFDVENLNSIIDKIKKNLPQSFVPIVQNITNRLIKIQNDESDEKKQFRMLFNFISLFKPGLITRSIFQQNSLILKNFAQPSPSVIERFNELLSVTPTLTLFEDTTNTFTSESHNKIYGFSNFFRIIGICVPTEKQNLSDAMLSRLTEIQVPEYSIEEQKNVFMTYLQNQVNKSESLQILSQAKTIFDKYNISFRQKIKIIEVSNQWLKKYPEKELEKIYSISILRSAGGSLSFEMRKKLYQLMKKNSFKFPSGFSDIYQVDDESEPKPDTYKFTTEKSCLNKEGTIVTSSLTGFTYPNISFSNDFLNKKSDLIFTKSINDLIDVIFSFSIINYPLIIEGPSGCGKSSAFFYVAQSLGMKVIHISLSQSTTIEDLFGRSEPSSQGDSIHFEFKPTTFLNAIDKERSNGEKYWILIEDLHLASPSVIDALEPIFNFKSNHVTLPDGSFIQKCNFFIVGLLSKPLQKQSIINAALYHKMPNYTKNEFSEICRFILETNELNDSVQQICPILSQLYEISASSQVKAQLTPREAYKFVKMMKAASKHSNIENKFSDIQICQLLSLGRFYDDELKLGIIQNINDAVKKQVFTETEDIPEFRIENSSILTSKNVSINSSTSIQSYMDDINHLTKSEKQLFEFLILNTDEYTPLIVQGPTASGKTFSIQLFAQILGKNLKVLQMNQEINSSFIAGSYNPSKNLNSNDAFELRNALELLYNISDLPEKFQQKLVNIDIDKWKLSDFLELKKEVENQVKLKKLDENNINNALEFINKVNSTLIIFKHIERNDSIIINALKNGDWLLLDGIESATPDFLDRLSSLLDDPPVLNLYERGPDYVFSMKSDKNNKTQLIDPNFRLFMTYNPVNSNSNNVSQSFLSRCTFYSMSPIDSNIFDSSIIVSNIIDKSVFSFSSQAEIAARIAKVHMKMKEEDQKQLTCRTLIHVSREIFYRNKLKKLDNEQIINIIDNHYHFNKIRTVFNEKIDKMLIIQLEKLQMDTIKIRNFMVDNIKELYQQIENVIKNKSGINIIFKYNEFLANMHILPFKNYDDIVHELDKVNSLIKVNINLFSKQQLSYLASFNTLSVLFTNVFQIYSSDNNSIKEEIQNLNISQIDVTKYSDFSDVIFQFQSFQYLYDNHFYLDRIPEILLNFETSNRYFANFKNSNPTFKRYQFNTDITPIQQICSTFFRYEDCRFLFTGIMEDIFLISYAIFSQKIYNNFCEWINWLNKFFNSFMSIINDFNITFHTFRQKIQIIENEKDPNLIVSLLNQIEQIKDIPKFAFTLSKNFANIYKIFSFIITIYKNLNELYINIADNKKYAQLFLEIKKRCENMKNSSHKIPIGYYIEYVNSLNEVQINKKIPLFVKIFNSIVKKESTRKELKLSWPTNENLGAIKEERSILFEYLISYSLELQKVNDIDINDPQWKLLCQLSEPKIFLTEFIETQKISILTIFNYISFLNAQLLTNIYESNKKDSYDYCNIDKLIEFFNKFITSNIEPSWLRIAKDASKNYPADFLISIPSFSAMDIVSLLANPLTKSHGCIFKENELPNNLIDDFYKLLKYVSANPMDQIFEFVNKKVTEIFIEYLKSKNIAFNINTKFEVLINNIINDNNYKNIHTLCQKILFVTKLCQIQKKSLKLDFSDIQKINFDDFNSYIEDNPNSGYYIAQFPEVQTNLEKVKKLCTNENIRKNKIPLALFEFRIISRIHSIKFQLPAEFPLSFCEEFQTCISQHLSFKNNTDFKFSNLVGFLLLNPPNFIQKTQYSKYVRDIIINLMTAYKEEMLLKEIMKIIINFLPKIIDVLGSPNWFEILNKELKYENTNKEVNKIINFLSNPWYFTLGQINNDFRKDYEKKNEDVNKSIKSILGMVSKLASDESIETLKECVEKDEADYQDKRVQLYINNERKNEKESENIQNLIKNWNYYSKHVKYFVDSIQPLPSSQLKSFEYKPQDWYGDFYDFFKEEKSCLPCKKEEVMVITPNTDTITIKFTKKNKKISINVKVNGMALFLNNKQIKYEIIGGNSHIISIPYDHDVRKNNTSTMKQVKLYYNLFTSFYKKVDNKDSSKIVEEIGDVYNYDKIVEKIGDVYVFFGSDKIDDLISYLDKIFKKYESFNEDDFYNKSYILDKIRNDLQKLEEYEQIGFLNEKVEIPHRTIDHISETLKAIITSSKNNLVESNFELFNNDFKKKYDFINNSRGIFQKTLKQSSSFLIKFDTIKAPNIDMRQIKESDSLLVPSIFRKNYKIKVTINEIRINIKNLLFGVDVTPLQIRLCNYTNKDIICKFSQNIKELPIPNYRNESGYVIIEIQVESICKKILEQKNEQMKNGLNDIESLFEFEGVLSLYTSDNVESKSNIRYSISLQYVSLTSFIRITNNHMFAIKDGVAKIVPFIAGPKTKISFEKFTNRYIPNINFANSIQELNDNKALKPNFKLSINKKENRICNIESSFVESNPDSSFLSMNYEFGLSKENIIPVEIKISTFPSNNNLYLAVYSDNENEFKESNGIITVGNIYRKVYFFIGYLNIGNEPISPSSVTLDSENYHIQTKFNEKMAKIQPCKYGYIISFFKVRYCGSFQEKLNMINATLTIKIGETVEKINFMYKINLLKILSIKSEISDQKLLYNDKCDVKYYKNENIFTKGNIKDLGNEFWEMRNQIFVSPYSYIFNNTKHEYPSVEYNTTKGSFIGYTNKTKANLEVLELTSKYKFIIKTYGEAESFSLNSENVPFFGRLEDDPKTFFPLFCPKDKIDMYFDTRKCTKENVNVKFNVFYSSLFEKDEKKNIGGSFETLFNGNPSSSNNFSVIVNHLGKNYNVINFSKLIHPIKEFTNYSNFEDIYSMSFNNLLANGESISDNQQYQFYAFISALNAISLDRYEDLQTSNFYLSLPIDFKLIKSQQNEMLSKIVDENEIPNCQYVNNFIEQTKEENEFEDNNIKYFEKNGYKITPILKWSQTKGLESSKEDEFNEYKEKQIILKYDIETDKNHDSSTDSINNNELIKLPKKVTLIALFELFDKICSLTSMIPFTIYSLKRDNISLENVGKLISQILSIYNWQNNSSECFPFSTFKAKFLPEFDAMMTRLLRANIKIDDFSLQSFDKNIENFVEIPSPLPIDTKISVFKQLGNQIIASKSSYEFNTEKNSSKEDSERKYDKAANNLKKNTITVPKQIIINKITYTDDDDIHINKKIIFKENNENTKENNENTEEINENTEEVSDPDFIKYLIEEMLQNNIRLIDPIEYKISNDSYIPKSIKKDNTINVGNERINSFIEASMKLSNVLIEGISNTDEILNVKDTIYSSILVDCSSTFSISQKVALVTLAIALGNSLTAIEIPYSIILFCESNFQFILKQVDESHDLIHFEKLLDTITIRRRMSDMSSAILMADDQIKSKDKSRTNHSMFVLTDGLTPKIRLHDQWIRKILNSNKRSIMFYFLDVLTKENDKNLIYPIWNEFRDKINGSTSVNNVIYSKSSAIYNGDSIFVEPFVQILKHFIGEYEPDNQIILPKIARKIKISNEFLDAIIDNICKAIIDEPSIYAQYSFPNDILGKFTDVDLNLSQPNPLISFSAGIGDISIELISKFLKELISASHSLFDNSILQDISALVFPPNRPSQYIPSENGNIFYFPGLMKFILTQGQDSKIFLEKKGGFIRSYSVFIIIDNSISCFNNATYTHSFQTILSLLYPLSKIDIPSLNIIITTSEGPVILCSEKPSMIVLDEKSPFWISLFSNLYKHHPIHSYLYSALMLVYQMRIQQKTQSSILFTLTDGCYEFNERNRFNSIFNALKASKTIPITVGIGMNPKFINLMTDKAIWSQNTKLIWNAILFLFNKDTKLCQKVKTCFSLSQLTNEKVNNLENLLLNKMFPELFDELNKVVRKIATYKNFYNKDNSKSINQSSEVIVENPSGDQYDLGKKDYYNGVKILIVMCWDYTCSDAEDHRISEEVLKNGVDNNRISVVNALNYFGIEVNIVKNYKDAIDELVKGEYSQVWIICGRMDGSMPKSYNTSDNSAKLIDQFIDCVIMYWDNGGGIAFWTDNYPLTAEVNKFLEKANFKVKDPLDNIYVEKKVNFHIGGDDKGQKTLTRSNKLTICTFDGNEASISEGYEKELFNHGLNKIFEGITIASAINGKEQSDEWKNYKSMDLRYADDHDIFPFKPFSKSSSGGYSSLYYMSPLDINNGDIVIDCGFSKLFFELTEEGIDRYVKNIAIWLLQLEKKDIKYGLTKDARSVAPPKFEFNINYFPIGISFRKFNVMKDVDLVFLIDGTGSMRFFVDAVRNCCKKIVKRCKEKFSGREFRYGSVVYRDTIVTEKNTSIITDKVDILQFTENPKEIFSFFSDLKTYGGGDDGPEDWVSGYHSLIYDMAWKENSIKIVIHICDAEGHGTSFTCDPNYTKYYYKIPCFSEDGNIDEDDKVYNEIQESQDKEFRILVQEAAQKGLMFYCLNNHKKSLYCFKKTRDLFLSNGGKKFVIQDQFNDIKYDNDDDKNNSNEDNDFDDNDSDNINFNDDDDEENDDDDDEDYDLNDSDDNEDDEENDGDDNDPKTVKQLTKQVEKIVKEAIDSSVAVSQNNEISEYERKCNEDFENDCTDQERSDKILYPQIIKKENHLRIRGRRGGRGRRGRRGGRNRRGGRGGKGGRGRRGGKGRRGGRGWKK